MLGGVEKHPRQIRYQCDQLSVGGVMQCPKCGALNSEEQHFCSNCGAPVSNQTKTDVSQSRLVDFVTLSCPSCGGKLQITRDIDRFACGYCGKEHLVNRGGGIVTLSPVIGELKQIRVGTDKTASELAIVRLSGEISEVRNDINNLMMHLQNEYCGLLMDFYNKDHSMIDSLFHPVLANDVRQKMKNLTQQETESMLRIRPKIT